jgi:hypothetical protein
MKKEQKLFVATWTRVNESYLVKEVGEWYDIVGRIKMSDDTWHACRGNCFRKTAVLFHKVEIRPATEEDLMTAMTNAL